MADVAVFTVGCKVNQAESEELKSGLQARGHSIVRHAEATELCVVNTCTVTAESDRKCRKLIRWLARNGGGAIVAAGCYAEVNPRELEALPGVIRVLPNRRKDGWLEEIDSLLGGGGCGHREPDTRRARAFLKVQDGCERACSYCIVPLARGGERSRAVKEVLNGVEACADKGVRELVLCGINLGRYTQGPGKDLAYLVREILSSGTGFRVRLSSIELEDLRTTWLEEWAGSDRVCPHIHLPLQSGDDKILRDMGRGYSASDYREMAGKLRDIWPGAALTAEVIVGYPGEDEAAFRSTLGVLEEARPSRVHVFRFSPRPGTRAWSRRAEFDCKAAESRSAELRKLAERWRLGYIEECRGGLRRFLVEVVEERNGGRIALGTTEDFIKGIMEGVPAGIEPGQVILSEVRGIEERRAQLESAE
ncbi:MAG: MiaB/RimO family radical SAM methylthiotransferase [Actinobacteria bacterium]|nr:MiaB/RimO family radical SAM methylthiotransferase [Actinomycetota bacterium]